MHVALVGRGAVERLRAEQAVAGLLEDDAPAAHVEPEPAARARAPAARTRRRRARRPAARGAGRRRARARPRRSSPRRDARCRARRRARVRRSAATSGVDLEVDHERRGVDALRSSVAGSGGGARLRLGEPLGDLASPRPRAARRPPPRAGRRARAALRAARPDPAACELVLQRRRRRSGRRRGPRGRPCAASAPRPPAARRRRARARPRRARSRRRREGVGAVDLRARDAPAALDPRRDGRCCASGGRRRRVREPVGLDDEDRRAPASTPARFSALVHVAGRERAVAQEGQRDARLAAALEGERRAHGERAEVPEHRDEREDVAVAARRSACCRRAPPSGPWPPEELAKDVRDASPRARGGRPSRG